MSIRESVSEWLALAFVLLLVGSISGGTQEKIGLNYRQGADGKYYAAMALGYRAQQPAPVDAPFAFRIAAPYIASKIPVRDPVDAFLILDLSACVLAAILLTWWLRRFIPSTAMRIGLQLIFWSHWLAPLRWSIFYPVLTDALGFAALLGLLLYLPTPGSTVPERLAFAGLIALAVTVRESLLLVALAPLFAANPVRSGDPPRLDARGVFDGIKLAAPGLLAGLFVWLALKATAPHAGRHSIPYTALELAFKKSFPGFLQSLFTTFGPVLVLLFLARKDILKRFAIRQDLGALAAMYLAAAWLGGADTERFLIWSWPIVLIALGYALERCLPLLRTTPWIAVPLLVAQSITSRIFWATPVDPTGVAPSTVLLTPLGEGMGYSDLFSHHARLQVTALLLLQHLALFGTLYYLLAKARSSEREQG